MPRIGTTRELIQRGAACFKHRLAVIAPEGRFTYSQLAERTTKLAELLTKAGIRSGTQVALVLPNSLAFLEWYFAVLEAGGLVVPLAPGLTVTETREILTSSQIQYLVLPSTITSQKRKDFKNIFSTKEGVSLWQTKYDVPLIDTPQKTDTDYLLRHFSSGSRGSPKHMMKTDENIAHDYMHFCDTLSLDEGENFLGAAPFYHAYGAIGFLVAFYLGGSVTILSRFMPGPVFQAARLVRPSIFLATPPMIEVLATCLLEKGDDLLLKKLKYCICSTGKLGRSAHEAFLDRYEIPVHIQYGSTETLSATIDLEGKFEEGKAGHPFDGVTVKIFDDACRPCPTGTEGSIAIQSPAASKEYVNDPKNSARTFINKYVIPGDKGYLDQQGCLYVLGRSDILNIGGYKVDPYEVEKVIREFFPVKEVVVLEGCRSGLSVVQAFIEADPACVTRSKVIDICSKHLSSYKVPVLIDIREEFERDANGKILKSSFYDY